MKKIALVVGMLFPVAAFAADEVVVTNAAQVVQPAKKDDLSSKAAVFNKPILLGPNDPIPEAKADAGLVQAGTVLKSGAIAVPTKPVNQPPVLNDVAAVLQNIEQSMRGSPQARQSTPELAKSLPGMNRDKGKPITITAVPGVNELVTVSSLLPNRIATPFKEPQVVDVSDSTVYTVGSSVFFLPKDENPVGIFITDKASANSGSTVLSLTLVPKKVPGQNIMVSLDAVEGISEEKLSGEAGEYSDQIRYLIRSAIRGIAPDGYVADKMKYTRAVMSGIEATTGYRYSSAISDIYQYALKNVSNTPISLTEQSFYQNGVKAVAFFPKVHLMPGQDTQVFILSAKPGTSMKGGLE